MRVALHCRRDDAPLLAEPFRTRAFRVGEGILLRVRGGREVAFRVRSHLHLARLARRQGHLRGKYREGVLLAPGLAGLGVVRRARLELHRARERRGVQHGHARDVGRVNRLLLLLFLPLSGRFSRGGFRRVVFPRFVGFVGVRRRSLRRRVLGVPGSGLAAGTRRVAFRFIAFRRFRVAPGVRFRQIVHERPELEHARALHEHPGRRSALERGESPRLDAPLRCEKRLGVRRDARVLAPPDDAKRLDAIAADALEGERAVEVARGGRGEAHHHHRRAARGDHPAGLRQHLAVAVAVAVAGGFVPRLAFGFGRLVRVVCDLRGGGFRGRDALGVLALGVLALGAAGAPRLHGGREDLERRDRLSVGARRARCDHLDELVRRDPVRRLGRLGRAGGDSGVQQRVRVRGKRAGVNRRGPRVLVGRRARPEQGKQRLQKRPVRGGVLGALVDVFGLIRLIRLTRLGRLDSLRVRLGLRRPEFLLRPVALRLRLRLFLARARGVVLDGERDDGEPLRGVQRERALLLRGRLPLVWVRVFGGKRRRRRRLAHPQRAAQGFDQRRGRGGFPRDAANHETTAVFLARRDRGGQNARQRRNRERALLRRVRLELLREIILRGRLRGRLGVDRKGVGRIHGLVFVRRLRRRRLGAARLLRLRLQRGQAELRAHEVAQFPGGRRRLADDGVDVQRRDAVLLGGARRRLRRHRERRAHHKHVSRAVRLGRRRRLVPGVLALVRGGPFLLVREGRLGAGRGLLALLRRLRDERLVRRLRRLRRLRRRLGGQPRVLGFLDVRPEPVAGGARGEEQLRPLGLALQALGVAERELVRGEARVEVHGVHLDVHGGVVHEPHLALRRAGRRGHRRVPRRRVGVGVGVGVGAGVPLALAPLGRRHDDAHLERARASGVVAAHVRGAPGAAAAHEQKLRVVLDADRVTPHERLVSRVGSRLEVRLDVDALARLKHAAAGREPERLAPLASLRRLHHGPRARHRAVVVQLHVLREPVAHLDVPEIQRVARERRAGHVHFGDDAHDDARRAFDEQRHVQAHRTPRDDVPVRVEHHVAVDVRVERRARQLGHLLGEDVEAARVQNFFVETHGRVFVTQVLHPEPAAVRAAERDVPEVHQVVRLRGGKLRGKTQRGVPVIGSENVRVVAGVQTAETDAARRGGAPRVAHRRHDARRAESPAGTRAAGRRAGRPGEPRGFTGRAFERSARDVRVRAAREPLGGAPLALALAAQERVAHARAVGFVRRLEPSRLVRDRDVDPDVVGLDVVGLDVVERPTGLLRGNAEVIRPGIDEIVNVGSRAGVEWLRAEPRSHLRVRVFRVFGLGSSRLEPLALRDARLHKVADAAARARRGHEPRPGRFARGREARRLRFSLPRLAQARRRRGDRLRAKLGLLAQELERGGVQDGDLGAARVFRRERVLSDELVGRLHPRLAESRWQVGVRPVAAQLRLRARQQVRGVAVLDAGKTQPQRVVDALAPEEHLDRLEVRHLKLQRLVQRLRRARAHAHRHRRALAPFHHS